jgi:hypothetical protein
VADRPRAKVVTGPNGELVLDDPDGLAVMQAVRRYNMYHGQRDGLSRLEARARQKQAETGLRFAVICINMDDPVWSGLGEHLMPGHDWDQYRKRGEMPFALGVVPIDIITQVLEKTLPETEVPAGLFTAVFSDDGVSFFEVAL